MGFPKRELSGSISAHWSPLLQILEQEQPSSSMEGAAQGMHIMSPAILCKNLCETHSSSDTMKKNGCFMVIHYEKYFP